MKENAIVNKALSLLAHPISLAAIGLYAINTIVLQRLSPNWLTGKLGDFAWVFVSPLAFTAILAWSLPERLRRYAFTFSILGTALIFGLLKGTSLNAGIVSGLAKLTGNSILVVEDGSDLLALMSLPATFWLWHRTRINVRKKYPAGIILTAFLALLTLADMAAPNLGITSIEFVDDAILACGGYESHHQSVDGGQTWQPVQSECEEMITSPQSGEVLQDPKDEKIQYKFRPGTIERSTDGGKTWQVDYQWMAPSEAMRMYYVISNKIYLSQDLPPFSAAIEPHTGNIFFAMGHEGILKRTAGTEPNYIWMTVGNYKKMDYRKSELLFNLLYGEWMLAIAAGCVGVTWLDTILNPSKIKKVLLTLGLIGMAACALFFPPAPTLTTRYFGQFVSMGIFIFLLLMLLLMVDTLINAGMKSKRSLFVYIIGFLAISILSFIPFTLWVYNIILLYKKVLRVAVALAILSIICLQLIPRKWISANASQP